MSDLSLKDFEILSEQDQNEALALLSRYDQMEKQDKCQGDFIEFVKHMWPECILGRHHKIIGDKFNKIAQGKLKRLIVCLPPRHSKSEFASTYFPAWMMGRKGDLKIIQTTHTAELAVRFGRKVRNIIDSDDYSQIFPDLQLQADNKSAGRWTTNQEGESFYAGVGGAITGRGADLLIIDDPHSEQDAMSPTAMESAYEWYTSGPRQRLQPGGIIIIVMTRWSTKDLVGKVLKKQGDDHADQWDVVEFPAIMPESDTPLWPEFWKKEELLSVKASLPISKWNSQWMQNPTAEAGSIVKREWWRKWENEWVPAYDYVIQSYDTAFSKKETADYSAITTWAIFQSPDQDTQALILLDAKRVRLDFPELKRLAYEEYKYWEPDCVLIEAKASGTPLTQELRRMGIPVTAYTPSRGQDKIARMNSVAPIFESGMVWAPDESFAEEVIEEMASFPFGDNDDYCDSATMALMRFRQGGFLSLQGDYPEEAEFLRRDRQVYY
ncbi:MAG: phage terminase large subunit [Synechococcales cyanobacterium H12SWP_bin.12]|jgi:predicted phage terminase large subunit-like protein|nr:phage terminase large subunit [Synechococcales cyanobacterium H12SWP_bin.12]